jgi:hypothetical protein
LRGGYFVHARQSDRSVVFLVLAFGNQVQPPLVVARFYLSTSLPHRTASGPQLGSTLMLPEMILRLRRGVVNGSTGLMAVPIRQTPIAHVPDLLGSLDRTAF